MAVIQGIVEYGDERGRTLGFPTEDDGGPNCATML
ncbi:riboflavin kinase [Arthrobacter sp. UYEF20]